MELKLKLYKVTFKGCNSNQHCWASALVLAKSRDAALGDAIIPVLRELHDAGGDFMYPESVEMMPNHYLLDGGDSSGNSQFPNWRKEATA